MVGERRLNLQGRLEGREDFPDEAMSQLGALVDRSRQLAADVSGPSWWALVVQKARCLFFDLSGFATAEDRRIALQALATLLRDPETQLVARAQVGLVCFGPGFYQDGQQLMVDWQDGAWAWFREPSEETEEMSSEMGPYRLDLSWLSTVQPGGLQSLHSLDTSEITNLETHLDPQAEARFHIEGGLRVLQEGTPIKQLARLAEHQLARWWIEYESSGEAPQEALFGFMLDSEVVFPMPDQGGGLDALRRELAAQIVGFEGVESVAWVRVERGSLLVRVADRSGWALSRRSLGDRSEEPVLEEGVGVPPWGDWWGLSPNQGLLQSKLVFSQGRTWGPGTVGEA